MERAPVFSTHKHQRKPVIGAPRASLPGKADGGRNLARRIDARVAEDGRSRWRDG